MTVYVLLITHEDIGAALLNAVAKTYGHLPLPTEAISITYQTNPDELLPQLEHHLHELHSHEGILILTDLFGSTPSNIASKLCCIDRVRVVAGLNLPMLMRVMNYPTCNLQELANKALSGGHDGVLDVA